MDEYVIERLGRQGDGIAPGPVFVARALVGERVAGKVKADRIAAPRILSSSPQRVAAPCRHFKACGGCVMQHASDDLVAAWKTQIVRDALERHAITTELRPILTSPPRSRRRAKYSARRTKSGAIAGFHARGSDTLIDVVDCPLVVPALADAPALCRALAIAGASRKGEITVQCTATASGLDVMVEDGKPLDRDLMQTLPAIARLHRVARLIWSGELVAQDEPPVHRIDGVTVTLPPGAFLQATDHGERALQACVQEALRDAKSAVDLFAGCGTFALSLSQHMPVTAVEGDRDMTRALQDAANHAGLTYPVTTATRDLFRDPLIAAELNRFDAVVLDPPRAGARAQCAELAASTVNRIAYVSCDPESFARDTAALIASGYRLKWVQPVDQFRWSAHVELAALLERHDKGATKR